MSRFIGHPVLFKASVVYDFIPYDWPGYLTSVRERIEYLSSLALLKTASHFFPISRYSAKRMQDLLGVLEAETTITGAAVRSSLYDVAVRHGSPSDEIGLDEGYFVTLGGSDSRKNTGAAIIALSELRRRTERNYRLIVIGDYTEEQKRSLLRAHPEMTTCVEVRANISDEV